MKTISIFNNKGGVGKTTLTFHLGHALAAQGKKTLIIDLDPQCNATILGMNEESLHEIWAAEDAFIEDFKSAQEKHPPKDFTALLTKPRSIHFLLKPAEDGTADLPKLPPPYSLGTSIDLIPGRLTMHLYEDKIAGRWSDVYQGDPLALRTVSMVRDLAVRYAQQYGYEVVIMDTSPSLGALNKVVISTTDGFLIPCMPDMFSLYGIRNIGNALTNWKKQFETIVHLLSDEKRKTFPQSFVRLLGFTIYNAKKYSGKDKPWDLATAHYNYAQQIPDAISRFIPPALKKHIKDEVLAHPVGETAIMHTHNTLPGMAQKYHAPIWVVPSLKNLEEGDAMTIQGNRDTYLATKDKYAAFTTDLLSRIALLP